MRDDVYAEAVGTLFDLIHRKGHAIESNGPLGRDVREKRCRGFKPHTLGFTILFNPHDAGGIVDMTCDDVTSQFVPHPQRTFEVYRIARPPNLYRCLSQGLARGGHREPA